MKEKEAEHLFDVFLKGLTSSLGFDRIESFRYARPVHDATALLSFPWHLSSDGIVAFNVWVGLRFEALVKWLDDEPGEMAPTLMRPIHFLREDKDFREWTFSNADKLEMLRNPILSDLKTYALPFIERYATLAALRRALESPDKQDWFSAGLNVDTRVTTLAAIRLVEGDKAGAIKTLDEGLKSLNDALFGRPHELRKRRFEMAYLRKLILGGTEESTTA